MWLIPFIGIIKNAAVYSVSSPKDFNVSHENYGGGAVETLSMFHRNNILVKEFQDVLVGDVSLGMMTETRHPFCLGNWNVSSLICYFRVTGLLQESEKMFLWPLFFTEQSFLCYYTLPII